MPEHDRTIQTGDLREGLRFSEPLFFDDGGHMFLASGIPLTRRLLDSLHAWGIPFVRTCGVELPAPVDEVMAEDIPELEPVD